MDKLVCVKDYELAAQDILSEHMANYFGHGSDEQCTIEENKNAFLRWYIKPRMLRNVSSRDISISVLGKPLTFPFGISPMAFQKVANFEGECASAKAAEKLGVIFTLSTFATSSIEEVAKSAPNCRKWFQVFMQKDWNKTKNHILRAENSGFEAIVLTLDAQTVGNRRNNQKRPFRLPEGLSLQNFFNPNEGSKEDLKTTFEAMSLYVHQNLDHTLSWSIIPWILKTTKLPVILKGIYNPEDAIKAVNLGIKHIIVSNHGGRQIDTVISTIDLLPEIHKAVGDRCEIYLDSGISRGSDIFKAIALGAKMVFSGKSIIWGLSVGGQDGVENVIKILKKEFDMTLTFCGVTNVKQITKDYVAHKNEILLK